MRSHRTIACFLATSLVALGLFAASGAPARAQLLVGEALNQLTVTAENLATQHKNRMAEALKERNLEKYRERIIDVRRETDAHLKQLQPALAHHRELHEAERRSLRSYFDQYGELDAWPASARERADTLRQRERELRALESTVAEVQRVHDRAKDIVVHLQNVTARGFSQGLQQYRRWADELGASLDHLRDVTEATRESLTPAAPQRIDVTNQSKEFRFTVNGTRLGPGDAVRLDLPPGAHLLIEVLALTEKRKLFEARSANPTRHSTVEEYGDHVFIFSTDVGAGPTRTVWRVEEEVYTWFLPTDTWKVPVATRLSSSGPAKDNVLRLTVPTVAAARFGEGGSAGFYVAARGSVTWSFTRRGKQPMPDKHETEHFHGGGLYVEVHAR